MEGLWGGTTHAPGSWMAVWRMRGSTSCLIKVTILLPGQVILDVAESINIINTGLQTRFPGEGIMMSKVGLVDGCYRFIDNRDNATMTMMVCFHDALTTPEGTLVTQQQLEEFGTRCIPGTFSDEDRRATKTKQGQKRGKKSTAAAPSALAVPRTRAVDHTQLNNNKPVLFSPSFRKRGTASRPITIGDGDGQDQCRSKGVKAKIVANLVLDKAPKFADGIAVAPPTKLTLNRAPKKY